MTKEYNDSLNRGLVAFILKSVATVLAVAGILLVSGIARIETTNTTHTREVYVDGELTERSTWEELDKLTAGIKVHIDIDESTDIYNK